MLSTQRSVHLTRVGIMPEKGSQIDPLDASCYQNKVLPANIMRKKRFLFFTQMMRVQIYATRRIYLESIRAQITMRINKAHLRGEPHFAVTVQGAYIGFSRDVTS